MIAPAETHTESHEIALPSKPVLEISGFHVTNSALAFFVVTFLIIIMAISVKNSFKLIPGRFQVLLEDIIGFFLPKLEAAWGDREKALKALPIFFTMFLVLMVTNQFVFLPFVSSLVKGGLPALRTPSTDLSFTLSIAMMMILGSHLVALAFHPIKHLGHYTRLELLFKARNIKQALNACLEVFIGFLEIIGDCAKMTSLAFRLFGNIFAGEVLVVIIQGLVSYIVPMPFILIAIFAGVIQSFVFTLLTLNFMATIMKPTFSEHASHA